MDNLVSKFKKSLSDLKEGKINKVKTLEELEKERAFLYLYPSAPLCQIEEIEKEIEALKQNK